MKLILCFILILNISCSTRQRLSPKVHNDFKINEKWIHPKIVAEFIPWASDKEVPLILSIDLRASINSNRFYGEVREDVSSGYISFENKEKQVFSYKWEGQLQNNYHVLLTKSYSNDEYGGSLVENHLIIFDITEKAAIGKLGENYNQTVLSVLRVVALGDRAFTRLTFNKNSISVDVKCDRTCDNQKFNLNF
jgi:hypothetical protein